MYKIQNTIEMDVLPKGNIIYHMKQEEYHMKQEGYNMKQEKIKASKESKSNKPNKHNNKEIKKNDFIENDPLANLLFSLIYDR